MPTINPDAYQRLNDDKKSASTSFTKMRDAIRTLVEMPEDGDYATDEYKRALQRAYQYTKIYLDQHPGRRVHENGRNRVKYAQAFLAEINAKIDKVGEMESEKIAADPQARKLGRLQSAIGVSRFIPKESDFEKRPSKWAEMWGSFKHKIYNALLAVSAVTIGGLVKLATVLATKSVSSVPETLEERNLDLVPGTKTGETFKEMDTETGGPNQPLETDVRRVPLTYEKLVPEDPNQSPTISVLFDQAVEGEDKAFAMVKGEKGYDNEMGHAFIQLSYSKPNPITGKLERYQSTFGFYPQAGFMTTSAGAAMGVSNTVIPGSVKDDSTHAYSTRKTFPATTQQINRIIKAAQQYKSGGYNYLTRSCNTFAKDMLVAAGIPTEELMIETDLNSGLANTFSFFGLFTGLAPARAAKSQIIEGIEEQSEEYQVFGQKKVSRSEIQNLSREEFNHRLRGYVPGHMSEIVRHDEDFHLGSTKYDPKYVRPESETREEKSLTAADKQITLMTQEKERLIASLRKIARERKLDIEGQIAEFSAYMDKGIKAIDGYTVSSIKGKRQMVGGSPDDIEYIDLAPNERKKMIREASDVINEFLRGLDETFTVAFNRDSELNIPFQHMVAVTEKMRKLHYAAYQDVNKDSWIRDNPMTNIYGSIDVQSLVRTDLDASAQLKLANMQLAKVQSPLTSVQILPMQLIGAIKAYGSLEAFLADYKFRSDSLKAKKDGHELNDEAEKRVSLIEDRFVAINLFKKSYESFHMKDHYTEDDIRFAFFELENGEDGVSFRNETLRPSRLMQGMIWGRTFPGIRAELKEQFKEYREETYRELQQLEEAVKIYGKGSPKAVLAQKNFELKCREGLSEIVSNTLATKMRENPDFARMIDITVQSRVDEYKQKGKEFNEEVFNILRTDVTTQFIHSLSDGFMRTTLYDLRSELLREDVRYKNGLDKVLDDAIEYATSLEEMTLGRKTTAFREVMKEAAPKGYFQEEKTIQAERSQYHKEIIKRDVGVAIEKKASNDRLVYQAFRDRQMGRLERLAKIDGISFAKPDIQEIISGLCYSYVKFQECAKKKTTSVDDITPLTVGIASKEFGKDIDFKQIAKEFSDPKILQKLVDSYNKNVMSTQHAFLDQFLDSCVRNAQLNREARIESEQAKAGHEVGHHEPVPEGPGKPEGKEKAPVDSAPVI